MRLHRALLPLSFALLPLLGCDADGDEDDSPLDASISPGTGTPDGGMAEDAALPHDAGGGTDSGADTGACPAEGCDAGPSAFRPEPRSPTAQLIASLELPPGFALNVYARDLEHARMLATHGEHVYLTRPRQGDVLRLADADGDGESEAHHTVARNLMGVHGIAFRGSTAYLATPTEVYRAPLTAGGDFGAPELIISDLPDGGQHPNRTLGIGPDDKLYISIGSSCDACMESNPEHATMLRAELDGSARSVFARGLRNTLGFAWQPGSEVLWGMDHGSDWRGDDLPPEELNRLEAGKDYGWPYCFADRRIDPIIEPPPDMTKEAYCARTTGPVLTEQAHGAPIAFVFYEGTSFPAAYRGSAFAALRGSWNRSVATGYKIVRLVFEGGQPERFEDFVTGFLIDDGQAHFGRLAGLTVAPDGALLFTDDENGYVYRVQAVPPGS
jgi:glucose/arabinose dehydrogenase